MTPCRCSAMIRAARRLQWKTPHRLTSWIRRHQASSASRKWRSVLTNPALLTSTSSDPNRWRVVSKRRSTSAGAETSQGTASASWPAASATARAVSALTSATTRRAPCSAKRSAIARPMPAGLLAKLGATLHALSGGRFVMGVSPSWHRDEYDALGISFADRGQLMEDSIGACRALWAGAPASFHSRTVNFDAMRCSPRPAAGERIPVWFTGKFTRRLVRRVAALGDGWMPYTAYGMTLAEKAAAIRELRAAAPPPLTMTETTTDPDAIPSDAEACHVIART